MPSSLRQATRKCMYLMSSGQFRTRDKDGGHTIGSAIAENLMFTQTSRLYLLHNRSYCRSKFYITGLGNFELFCSCDPKLEPMTFIYEPDPCSLKMYRQTRTNFLRQSFRKLSHFIHTYSRQTYREMQLTIITNNTITTTLGDRSFTAAGPHLWNNLPLHIRDF